MKLYNFNQNNSGGSFNINENVTYDVLIEAESYDVANYKAEECGIEFYVGCPCCGDRWNQAYDNDIDNYSVFEFIDKEAALNYFNNKTKGMFREECIIYFKDGTKERITYKS